MQRVDQYRGGKIIFKEDRKALHVFLASDAAAVTRLKNTGYTFQVPKTALSSGETNAVAGKIATFVPKNPASA